MGDCNSKTPSADAPIDPAGVEIVRTEPRAGDTEHVTEMAARIALLEEDALARRDVLVHSIGQLPSAVPDQALSAAPGQALMDQQLALVQEALRRAQFAPTGGVPIDISVARQRGEYAVTIHAQVIGGARPATRNGVSVPASTVPPLRISPTRERNSSFFMQEPQSRAMDGETLKRSDDGVVRNGAQNEGAETPRSLTEGDEVANLLSEIERLKRQALSRGINLASPQEDVPAEDVAMLRQAQRPSEPSTPCACGRGISSIAIASYLLQQPLIRRRVHSFVAPSPVHPMLQHLLLSPCRGRCSPLRTTRGRG